MTPLAVELLRILQAEATFPPMTPASLGRVLHAIGFYPVPSETEIVLALESLMAEGYVEAVHSARLGRRFRVLQNGPREDLSEPGAA